MKLHFAIFFSALWFCHAFACAAEQPLQIFVGGDVLLGRGIARTLDSPHNALQKWRSAISSADLAFCNLECAVSTQRPHRNTQLLATPDSCKYLQRAGIDIVSTANNHALDAGEAGVRMTQSTLSDLKIVFVGSRWNSTLWMPYRTTIRGRRVAWLAATAWGPFQNGKAQVRPIAGSGLIDQVQALSRAGELVLVSLHWGVEYSKAPSEGQKRIARALIDAGASAVIGHHPHVAQPVETYRGRPIFYSLGNFLFDQTRQKQSGLAAVIAIDEKRRVSWRSFEVKKIAASTGSVSTPADETLIAQHCGHFLLNEKRPQILTWTKLKSGLHHLRLLTKNGEAWRVMAQGFHANIWDLQIGDIDGDGRDDIVVGLFQRAKLDTQIKRRLHIYDVNFQGGFRPKWRGSALSRPFRQFVLLPNGKGVDVVSVENNPLPEYRGFEWIAVYRWNGFGLRLIWDTPVRGVISELQSGKDAHGVFIGFRQKADNLNRTLALRMRHNEKGEISFYAE